LQFETLDQLGLLARFLPEWDSVRCHSQRNAFHRYTVDRHLLETVAQACALVRRVERPDLLLVGALFHDLGKGTPGDHTSNGVAHAAPASLPSDLLQSPTLARFDGTVSVVPGPNAVTIVAPDALGLLAIEVAVLGVHAQSVRSARTYTVDDIAIGEFVVEPEHGRVPDWDRVAADLRAALADPEP